MSHIINPLESDMNNLELADWLQASASNHYGNLSGVQWDAGAALRNLHTENMALRCTEMALRDINAELVEALGLIAETDHIDAALDPQRAVHVARAALAKAEGGEL